MLRGVKILKSSHPVYKVATQNCVSNACYLQQVLFRLFSDGLSVVISYCHCESCRPDVLKFPPISGDGRPFLTPLNTLSQWYF